MATIGRTRRSSSPPSVARPTWRRRPGPVSAGVLKVADVDPEAAAEELASLGGDRHRPVGLPALDPTQLEEPLRERRTERAGDMQLALAPVEAAADEGAAALRQGAEVDSERSKARLRLRAELV